jgi:hypothetical protein
MEPWSWVVVTKTEVCFAETALLSVCSNTCCSCKWFRKMVKYWSPLNFWQTSQLSCCWYVVPLHIVVKTLDSVLCERHHRQGRNVHLLLIYCAELNWLWKALTWNTQHIAVTGIKMTKTGHATWDIAPMVPRSCITENAHQPSLFAICRSKTVWSFDTCYKVHYTIFNFKVCE